MLVERSGFLGGIGTGAMLGVFCGLYDSGARPRQLATAFGWTLVRALLARRACFRSRFGNTYLVHYDPEQLKLLYDELMTRAGVRVMVHALCVSARVSGCRIESIDVHTRGEPLRIHASVFIDASGDADLAFRAGVPLQVGDGSGAIQPASAVFRMAEVDLHAAASLSRAEMNARMREDVETGAFALPRVSGSFYPTTNPGEVVVNMTRVFVNGADAVDLSRGEAEGRRQVWTYATWLRARVPGFANAYVSAVASILGLRETRRLIPHRWLNADSARAGERSDDEVGTGAWPFEVHDNSGSGTLLEWLPDRTVYSIPLSAVSAPAVENLLVCGRCLGAQGVAHASARVMGSCFSMGEGAGLVAAAASRTAVLEVPPELPDWHNSCLAPDDSCWPLPPEGVRA
jgi:hypothetical protein